MAEKKSLGKEFTKGLIAENPVFFILGLLASLVLTAFLPFAVWAIVRTEKILKKIEQNILTLTKGKTEK